LHASPAALNWGLEAMLCGSGRTPIACLPGVLITTWGAGKLGTPWLRMQAVYLWASETRLWNDFGLSPAAVLWLLDDPQPATASTAPAAARNGVVLLMICAVEFMGGLVETTRCQDGARRCHPAVTLGEPCLMAR